MRLFATQFAATVTETTTKTFAGVSVGAETVNQLAEAAKEVSILYNVSMVVAIGAGLVAILSAIMNYRINNIRLDMEREEHAARMKEIQGLRDEKSDRLRGTGTTPT